MRVSSNKIVITKFWRNEIYIVFQRIWVQSLIFVTRWTNVKSFSSISAVRVDFWLESPAFGVKGTIRVLVPFPWDCPMFLSRSKRRSWVGSSIVWVRGHTCVHACSCLLGSPDISLSLKEKILTWIVDLWGRWHVYVLGLFTRDHQTS